jgi:hypothetical protein
MNHQRRRQRSTCSNVVIMRSRADRTGGDDTACNQLDLDTSSGNTSSAVLDVEIAAQTERRR